MSLQQNGFQHNAFQVGADPPVVLTPFVSAAVNFGEPVFTRRVQYPAHSYGPLRPIVSFGWMAPLSEPVRQRPRQVFHQPFFPATNPIVSFSWMASLSEPVRERPGRRTHASAVASGLSYLHPVFASSIFSVTTSFSGPVFIKQTMYQSQSTYVPLDVAADVAPAISVTSAGPEFSRTVIYPSYPAYVPLIITAGVTPDFGWNQPLSDIATRPRQRAAHYQDFTYGSLNPIVSFGWAASLSEPVRTKRIPTAAQHVGGYGTLNPIVSFSWMAPLSEPARQPRRTPSQPFHFYGSLNPIVSFGYFNWLSEPPSRKRNTPSPDQFFQFTPTATPGDDTAPAISVTSTGPVFDRTVIYPSYATFVPVLAPAVVPSYGWFSPFAELPRIKDGRANLHTSGSIYLRPVFDSAVFGTSSFGNSPTFVKKVQYQSWAYRDNFAPPILPPFVSATIDFGDPVFTKRVQYQSWAYRDTFVAPTPPMDSWFVSLADPVRFKKGLAPRLQQSLAQGTIFEIFNRSPSTGPLYIRSRGGNRTTFWKGRTS